MTSFAIHELLQHTGSLRALARELVGDSRADDIVQETAIQTMIAPPRRPGPAGGWLMTVVRNVASKHRRAERTRRRHESKAATAAAPPADRGAEDADTLRKLTEIVTSLPEPYRQAILARYLRQQTPSEIAAATNTPVSTVKTRLQRGLVLLRERLDEDNEDWRTRLIAAFAINPTARATGPILMGTNKLVLVAAVLLPFLYVFWSDAPNSLRTPSETPQASQDGPAAATASLRQHGVADDIVAVTQPDPTAPRTGKTLPQAGPELPADPPLMRLDVVGPAAFRRAFLPTNLGGMFTSEQGEQLWRPLLAPAEHLWRQWDGRGEEFQATRERVLAYAGRIRVLWMVQPGEGHVRDRVFGVFSLEMDDHTDLATLAGDLSRPMRAIVPREPTEQTVGDHALQLLDDPSGEFVTIPMLIDNRVVAFFGEVDMLDQAVPRCLRALAMDNEPATAPLSLHIDLAQLKGLAGVRDEPVVHKLFGLDSLQSLDATMRPNGVHVQLEIEVAFGDGDRGLLAGFMPAVEALPRLLARIPAQATPWLTVPFRPDVIFRTGLEAAAEEQEEGGIEALRQEMHDELGMYLDTELLDHIGGEVMVLGDLWQNDDPAAFRRGEDLPLGACIAFSLRDTAAFGKGLDQMLDYFKGHVHQHETREVNGVKITRLGSMFLTGMHMAVGQDLFAMAFGEEGVTQLEALVAGPRGIGEPPLPAPVQHVKHLAPEGWNGLGLANLRAMLGGQVALVIEALDEALPSAMGFDLSVDDTQAWLDRLLPLVDRHGLGNLVTMTGYDDGHWRLRLLW